MRKKPDHLQAVINEVAGKIAGLQDLLRGLHRLKGEREREGNLTQRAQGTEPVRPRQRVAEKTREKADGKETTGT